MKTTENLIELYCKENIADLYIVDNYFIIGSGLVIYYYLNGEHEKYEISIDLLDYMTFLFNLANKEN